MRRRSPSILTTYPDATDLHDLGGIADEVLEFGHVVPEAVLLAEKVLAQSFTSSNARRV